MSIQTILFDKETWNQKRARAWLKGHGAKAPKVDARGAYYRYRQAPPFHFKKGSFRTKEIDPDLNIKAVVACPQEGRSNPMPTLLAINPKKKKPRKARPKKKATSKKGPKPMAKKKGKKKGSKKGRKNPSFGGAASYARNKIAGIDFKHAFKTAIPMLFGAIAGKFTAKRFAEGGAELEDWTWKNYLLCIAGGAGAAIASRALLKLPNTTTQNVFMGAAFIVAYKIFTLELAPKNSTLSEWFGGFGEEGATPSPAALPDYARDITESYGQIWEGGETDYVQGADGYYRPIDESHRLPETAGYGDVVVPAGPTMGDVIVPAGPTMGEAPDPGTMAAKISREFQSAY